MKYVISGNFFYHRSMSLIYTQYVNVTTPVIVIVLYIVYQQYTNGCNSTVYDIIIALNVEVLYVIY